MSDQPIVHKEPAVKFRRGDAHPDGNGLVFLRYQYGRSRWGTPGRLRQMMNDQNRHGYNWGKRNRANRRLASKRSWARNRDKRCAELRISGAKRRASLKAAGPDAIAAHYAKYKDKANQRLRERAANDHLFRFRKNLARRIGAAFKYHSAKKLLSTHALLGCTLQEARDHIEKQFTTGMTWSNHKRGGWHVDHKIPLASAKSEQELISLCHYKNLQPLWEPENIAKGAKILPMYLS